ncbi:MULTISPECIES: hypothetical protein [unclassified Streptomyces]|uniref:hypothetical protein n=1 Tax=unclassified Streptomyces TaxID=2593676 RepID=UPI0004BECFD7|nr:MULTISPECIES: hypothetical protein [unclassified Streptomyces]
MRIRGTTLRLAAVLALVVLALTGFSSRGHGGHGHGGSGGGGCSSSSQDHDSYHGSDDDSDDDSYGGSSGGYRDRDPYDDNDDDYYGDGSGSSTASSLDDATVELVDCATTSRPYTKVRVTNPNGTKGTFTVTVVFKADLTYELDTVRKDVEVPANGTVTAKVRPSDDSFAAEIEECDPAPRAPEAS